LYSGDLGVSKTIAPLKSFELKMPPVVPAPTVPINFVQAKEGDIIKLGKLTLRVMEDGSRTGT
jgi:hypothetical protein